MPYARAASLALLALISCAPALADDADFVGPGIAMHGDVKYKPGFTHFDYTDPAAPKGGEVREAAIGTYDSLNPFILKGVPAAGIGLTFDTLMVSSQDEAFSEYGLVAETIEVPKDRSWTIFTLRPEARFQDGSPITADDVVWTFDTLKAKGHPSYAAYYHSVVKAEKLGERKVKFSFAPGDNRELPLILGQLPVLSKKYYESHDFEKTALEAPLGSGPYKVAATDPGRSITLERVKDYWGKDLPVNKGRYNFDRIRIDYYRDDNVSLEAFKAGDYDFRQENSSKSWATGYDAPAVRDGRIKKEEIPNEEPQGMQGYVYNIRRDVFKDARVRSALAYAFDFEWSNKTLFYGQYARTESYFSNSELASRGLPSADELKVLEPLKGQIPDEVFTKQYEAPKTDGSGNIRPNLAIALKLLEAAGWTVKDGKMVDPKSGQPLSFEILLDEPAFERITEPFVQNLRRLGVDARIRTVDTAQYKNRLDNFDFDVIVGTFGESLSPGNEQRDYWGSESADIPGGANLIGIKDKAIDRLVDLVISAPDREALVTRTHALDRVLLWHYYVIPHWHITYFRVGFWDKFGRPKISPKYALGFIDDWWVDPAKAAALKTK
ncbi:MAG: extracellular solute-binding protein [Alphaproteobacteria bacterium]